MDKTKSYVVYFKDMKDMITFDNRDVDLNYKDVVEHGKSLSKRVFSSLIDK